MFHRLFHAAGIVGLYADDFNIGADLLDKRGHTCSQPAAAYWDEHGIDFVRALAHDFHTDGALPRNHIGIVKRRDIGQVVFCGQFHRMVVGIVVRHAFEHHFGSAVFNRINLNLRRGFRHYDDRAATQPLRRERHPLRMVARAGGNHAASQRLFRQFGHFVVCAADFKRKNRL